MLVLRKRFDCEMAKKFSALTQDSLINLIGSIIPVAAAVPCYAVMARMLSPAQFSLVLLAWALVGYAGILDLGLSRAVVTVVAEVRSNANVRRQVVSTALCLAISMGLLGAIILHAFAQTLVVDLLKVAPENSQDAIEGFRIVAITIPFLLFYLIVQGYWDGLEVFIESNLQRTISGSLPLLLATMSIFIHCSFKAAMLGLLVGRVIVFFVILFRQKFYQLLSFGFVSKQIARRLIAFGGWITLSNTISPIMGYLDRYILALAKTGQIVSFYAAPAEIVLKMLVVPQSITRSMYPKLISANSSEERQRLLISSYKLILSLCVPATSIILLFAPQILELWLGQVYAKESTTALRILAVGFLSCSVAQVPFCHIQARNQPRVTTFIQLAEVVPFVICAYLMARKYGVTGIALTWSIRCSVDLIILWFFSRRIY
jgi:O-antigen/teichoic acid export membrane protein